jgi:hypothetical protein
MQLSNFYIRRCRDLTALSIFNFNRDPIDTFITSFFTPDNWSESSLLCNGLSDFEQSKDIRKKVKNVRGKNLISNIECNLITNQKS